MSWLHIMIFIPFVFAIIIPFLYKLFNQKIHTGWFVLPIPILIFSYLSTYISTISKGQTFSYTFSWIPSLNINFIAYLDGLSLLFGLIITGIGALVILYSIYYMSKEREALHNFYVYLCLFMGAMLGVVFSDHILVLYVFWELTSISSFLLIAYWFQRKQSRYGAQKALLITVFGGLVMLTGFIMLSMISGTYSIREMLTMVDVLKTDPLFIPAMITILIGAFTKSAQFPFSIWLPDAMEAPTPISAYLHSATMVKAGIYLVARFTPVFGGNEVWFWLVSGIGLITLLYGSINAVRQTDLKALLAYSTISQLGLIMSLLGVGSAAMYFGNGEQTAVYSVAVFAAIFHLINHSTFKGALFMVVGIIDHETGTRDIRKLRGLIQVMPITFTLALIGSFSMAGLPPFNGFLSKEMFFTAMLNIVNLNVFNMDTFGILFPVIAWIASVLTFVYCMILVLKPFMGKHQADKLDKVAHEPPIGMLIAPTILAVLVILIFFFPNILGKYLISPAYSAVLPAVGDGNITISAWHGWDSPELMMTVGVVILGLLLYRLLPKWIGIYRFYPQVITLNNLYNEGLDKSESLFRKMTNKYMNGSLRSYLIYILVFIVIILMSSSVLLNAFIFDASNDAPISFYEWGLIIAAVFAALTVLFAKSRMVSLISVGALGYLVSMFFVIFRAPDLALTQFVVETVTTALFLLCFYHLPRFGKYLGTIRFKLTNLLVSIGVGVTVTLIALSANGYKVLPSIKGYFENAYELAGAKNIVNAILVDFRGFDTMLEISVLTIAGLGVYTLIKLQLSRRDKNETK